MGKNIVLKLLSIAMAAPLALTFAIGPASADCKSGYVYRDAQDGDGVCVTPDERAEAKAQNAEAEARHRALLIEQMKFTIAKLRHEKFGPSSERGDCKRALSKGAAISMISSARCGDKRNSRAASERSLP